MTTVPPAAAAPRSRSGPPRNGPGAPQLAGARMALYLAAAVVGVIVIVFVVVQLTKSGSNKAAAGSSTPSTGTTASTGPNGTNGYVFTQAAKVGTSFPLNKTATKAFTPAAVNQSTPIADEIKAKGYGKPGKRHGRRLRPDAGHVHHVQRLQGHRLLRLRRHLQPEVRDQARAVYSWCPRAW